MAQSTEYPDLPWRPPNAYGTGRDGKAVRYIVIHYTAGAERNTSAEDGAAFDARRTDGVSTHYFVDSDSVVQCVLTRNRGNAARHRGNRLGIQYELCGTVQTRAQWLDAASLPTLRNAARQVARDCRKYDIPVRRLSVAETRAAWTDFPNGPKGIVGHVDCTNAYPEDGGDHTDPGTEFPWSDFLRMVRDELEGDDMNAAEMTAWAKSAEGKAALGAAVVDADADRTADGSYTVGGALVDAARRTSTIANVQIPALANGLAAVASKVDVDEDEAARIATALLPHLSGDQLADMIRKSMSPAERTALAARITAA